ncbi:MAG: hypothetical protein IKF11_05205 [Methanobrevibacter sp.]|nr:hypothetical protein [Methanobrevibacter sp.]
MSMYNVPTENCNLEIMGYPFFVEEVSPSESFNRRDPVINNLVGGTLTITKGPYIPLEFSITTHVFVDPDRPDEHNNIFKEMMSKPVEVISPEIGGMLKALVVITPVHEKGNSLKLKINIKEVPDSTSNIPGESWVVPAPKDVEVNGKTNKSEKSSTASNTSSTKQNSSLLSKVNAIAKKNKGA